MQTVTFNLGLEGIKNQVVALRIAQAKVNHLLPTALIS